MVLQFLFIIDNRYKTMYTNYKILQVYHYYLQENLKLKMCTNSHNIVSILQFILI